MQFGPAAGEVRCRSCHGSIRGRIALLCAGRRKLRNADALPEAARDRQQAQIDCAQSAICRLLDTAINQRIDIDAFMVQPTRVLPRAWVRGLGACKYPLVTKLQRNAAFRNVATHEAQAPPLVPSPLGLNFFSISDRTISLRSPPQKRGPSLCVIAFGPGSPAFAGRTAEMTKHSPRAHEYGP